VVQKLDSKFVKNGEIMHFDQPLPFEHSYVAEHRSATVLPLFGMILANGTHLIPESLHHRECHFDVFTAAVRAIHEERALLVMPEAEEVDLSSALFIGANNNYYHWLIDELPRLSVLERSGLDDGRPILIDKHAQKWQLELLSRFGIPQSRLVKADFNRPQRVQNLLAPSHLSTLMVAHPLAVEYVREKLLKNAKSAAPKKGKRLYVARAAGTVAGRSIINADEVWEKFRKAGFKRVDPGTMTIDEQIRLFRDVEIIAGPGGAGLTNAVFAPPGAKVLNLTSSDIACQTFTSIAASIGQESWFCGGASMARPYPRWIWTNFDYLVDLRDVDICIAALTA
jgi:capsular polysaccharide biosynthesis protein